MHDINMQMEMHSWVLCQMMGKVLKKKKWEHRHCWSACNGCLRIAYTV